MGGSLATPFGVDCGRQVNSVPPRCSRSSRTRWMLGQPSVHPSMDYGGNPRCHYWLRDGRIHWVPNRTTIS